MRKTTLFLILGALAALSACDKPKPRDVPAHVEGDPIKAATAAEQPADPPVEGRTAGLKKRAEYPAAYLDHVGAAADPLKKQPAVTPAMMNTQLDGFAYDGVAMAPAKGVELVIDGKAYAAKYGIPRADVASFAKNSALDKTGYVLVLPATTLNVGDHMVAVRVIAADGVSYFEIPAVKFSVK